MVSAANSQAKTTDADTLGNIRHRIECATSTMDSLEKTMGWIAERASDEEVCSVFFTVGNCIEAIKREIDAAVGVFENRRVRP